MPVMSASVARGWFLNRLDEYFNSGTADYQKLLKCISRHKRFTKILTCSGLMDQSDPEDAAFMQHLNDHWFSSGTRAWWPNKSHREEILILALKQLTETHCDYPDLKVSVLWVCTANMFQTNLVRTNTNLTLLVMTPPIPAGAFQLPETKRDRIHVIAESGEIQAIVNNATMWGGRPKKKDITKYVDELPTKNKPGKRIWGVEVFTARRSS